MSPIRRFARRHPVLSYYVLVFAISWGGILFLVAPVGIPGIITNEARLQILVFSVAWGLMGGGLLEELGWTGFAVPALRERFSVMQTGLIVGVLSVAWHLLIAVWASRGMTGETSLVDFIGGFVAFYFLALPAYRVLMVWLYDHTASLLLAILMHAVLSASTLVLQPLSTEGHVIWNLLLGVALWIVVAVVAIRQRGELSRPPVPPKMAHAC